MPNQIRLYIHASFWGRDEQYARRQQSPMQGRFVKKEDASPLRVSASFNLSRKDGSVDVWLLPEEARRLRAFLYEGSVTLVLTYDRPIPLEAGSYWAEVHAQNKDLEFFGPELVLQLHAQERVDPQRLELYIEPSEAERQMLRDVLYALTQ